MLSRSSKPPKRPRDINQLAYEIVQEATGQRSPTESTEAPSDKNPAAVALGKLGGSKGGLARAEKLSPKRRSAIARKAARARWSKTKT